MVNTRFPAFRQFVPFSLSIREKFPQITFVTFHGEKIYLGSASVRRNSIRNVYLTALQPKMHQKLQALDDR